jgi:hypothetical protein
MTHIQGPDARRCDAEVTLRSAAALRRRIAEPGRYITLFFQPVERAIHRPYRHGSARASFDFAPHGNAVGILPESENGEERNLLEFAEMLAGRHMLCTVGQNEAPVKRRRRMRQNACLLRENDIVFIEGNACEERFEENQFDPP